MSSKRKNFYIHTEFLSHLSSQPNQSFYINNLIRKDLNSSHQITRSDIIKLIKEYLPNQSNSDQITFSDSINNILKFKGDE